MNKNILKNISAWMLLVFGFMLNNSANAQCSGGTNAGTTLFPSSTFQVQNCVMGGEYYEFNTIAGYIYTFSFCQGGGSGTWDTQITILDNTGTFVGAPGYNDDFCGLQSELTWTAPTTGTYRVLINQYSCNTNTNCANLAYRGTAPPPPVTNDDCDSAIVLVADTVCNAQTFSLSSATQSMPACSGTANDDVWFMFVATSDRMRVDVNTTNFDPVIELFSGTCGALTSEICANGSGSNSESLSATCYITVGDTFYVRVHSSGSSTVANSVFDICVYELGTPSSTDIDGAIHICDNSTQNNNSSGAGNNDLANVTSCLSGEHQSSWYVLTVDSSGTLAFMINPITNSDYDFAVFGPNPDACNLNSPIRCSWAATPPYSTGLNSAASDFSEGAGGDGIVAPINAQVGEVYYILIDNWSNNNTGFNLVWNGTAGLSNAFCTFDLSIDLLNDTSSGTGTPFCHDFNNASLECNVDSGGIPPFTYVWNTVPPTADSILTNIGPGTYTCVVTDSVGTVDSISITLNNPPEILLPLPLDTARFCAGDPNSALTATLMTGGSVIWYSDSLLTNQIGTGTPFNPVNINNAIDSMFYAIQVVNTCTSMVDSIRYIIDPIGNPGFSYTDTLYCQDAINPIPTISGDTGGVFSAIPAGITLNTSTGEIDLASSTVGTYTIQYLTQGNCPDSSTFNVTVYPRDIISAFSYNTPAYCINDVNPVLTFNTTAINGYFYSFPSGLALDSTTGAIDLSSSMANTPGQVYTIIYQTTSPCPISDTTTVYVNPIPVITLANDFDVCDTHTANLTANINSSLDYTYSWTSIPSGFSSTTTLDTSFVPTQTTTYILTVVDSLGCSSTDSVTITVNPLPVPMFMAAGDTTSCDSLAVDFINMSTNGISYVWNFGNGQTSTAMNPPTVFYQNGLYSVTLKVTSADGCVDTHTKPNYVEVIPTPQADFTSDRPFNQVMFEDNGVVQFTNNSQDAITYLWDFGDGQQSTLANPFHDFNTPGQYDVTLIAMNKFNCADTIKYGKMIVQPTGMLWIPNAFTPNGDYLNDLFEVKSKDTPVEYSIKIFDRWGSMLFESTDITQPWDGTYKGKTVQEGAYVYVIEAKFADGNSTNLKNWFNVIR